MTATARTQLVGHDGPIHVVRFTADGKYGWTAGHDRTVRLWNPFKVDPVYVARSFYRNNNNDNDEASAETLAQEVPHALGLQTFADGYTYPIYAMAVNPDSTLLLASSDRTVILTDVLTQKLQRRIAPAHEGGRVNCLSFWETHNHVWASGSVDATVQLWDVRASSSSSIQTLKDAKDSITSLFCCGSTSEILTASVDGCLRTYDVRRGQMRCDALVVPNSAGGGGGGGGGGDGVPPIVSMDVTERLVVLGCLDNSLRLLERSTGELLRVYHGAHVCQAYAVECGFVSRNDENNNSKDVLATGSENGALGFYSCWQDDSWTCLFSPSNRRNDQDDETKDGEQQQQQQEPQEGQRRRPVCSMATHGSQVLAASYNGIATLYQCTTTM